MVAAIQRVSEAKVTVQRRVVSSIKSGVLILVGVHAADTEADAEKLSAKVSKLRFFEDSHGKMNRSLLECDKEILLVSQFTLCADLRKGARPSFNDVAKPDSALRLFNILKDQLEYFIGIKVQTGEFGAKMAVSLINDGPVTFIIDTHEK